MKSQEQVWAALIEANPVPDVDIFGRENMDDAAHLATLQPRSSEMTQLSTKETESPNRNRTGMAWLVAAALVLLVGVAIIFLNQGSEEPPPATDPVPTTVPQPSTTVPQPSTTVAESALADIPVWLGSGNGQWVPARSSIPFAFTNSDNWNSRETALSEELFTICPASDDGAFALCNLAIVAVLFLEPETIDETRDLLATFEGAELGEEQSITIDGAPGITFEFTHDVAPLVGQAQGELAVPAASVSTATERTPLGQGPMGRSIISIVDVDGVIVTLTYQGVDAALGAPQDGFNTYRDAGLAIIDSIIWGTP